MLLVLFKQLIHSILDLLDRIVNVVLFVFVLLLTSGGRLVAQIKEALTRLSKSWLKRTRARLDIFVEIKPPACAIGGLSG